MGILNTAHPQASAVGRIVFPGVISNQKAIEIRREEIVGAFYVGSVPEREQGPHDLKQKSYTMNHGIGDSWATPCKAET